MAAKVNIVLMGTLDTKLTEYLYLRSEILALNPSANIILIDTGRSETKHEAITIPQPQVRKLSYHERDLKSLPRGEVIKTMIACARRAVADLCKTIDVHGVVALGGSGGTSLAAAVMRELPLAMPKLMVSTVASGDVGSYIGDTDITMMYSVVDIAGMNQLLRAVIGNAAAAISGMALRYASRRTLKQGDARVRIAITMFGVTTPAVEVARRWLEGKGYEVYVFHATGTGGRSMERLISEGLFKGVLDLTTTELADEVAGGVFSAGETRLTSAARGGVPQIVSVGALDLINFGPRDTLPAQFRDRKIFEHNPSVTVVRTTPEECKEIGRRLATRLRNFANPNVTEVWLPLKGISAIAVEGQAFHDREADEALFSTIKQELARTGIRVNEVDVEINDPVWAEGMARRLAELIESNNRPWRL
ncbi:hypothetical protein GGS21DRAFT_440483 [Xylaria nigripes]|nr:hypothetical protein GGS21DRAFT_440483 [Xylaria nigripes]